MPSPLLAQGVIVGRVVDEQGMAVAAARVTARDLRLRTTTTDSGGFRLPGVVPAGSHRVEAAQIGFEPARLVVRVAGGRPDTVRVVLTLRRTALPLEAVQVTATLSAREPLAVAQSTVSVEGSALDRSLGSSLGATLERQPGIAARYQGPGASAPIIRGLSGDRIVILQDGQRTGDLSSTAPDHGVTVDPAGATRIEVVRGPAALLYGNNAIGGVVNVISEDIPATLPARAGAAATLSAESASPGGATHIEAAAPLGERGALSLRAGARSHGDARLGRGADEPTLDNSHLRAAHATVGVARVGAESTVGAALRHYRFEYGLPAGAGIFLRGHRHEVLARAESRPGRLVEELRVDGSAQWYEHDELAPAVGDAPETVVTALALRTYAAQALARTRPVGPLRDGAVGLSALVRHNGVSGSGALTPPSDSRGVGMFAIQDLPLGGGVRVPMGLRYDRYALESRASEKFGPGRRRVFGGLSGSVGLVVPVGEDVSAGLTVARAFRSPTVEELFSQAGHAGTGAFEIGDPALDAERSVGLDAVLRIRRRALSATISGYRNGIAHYIALLPAGRDTIVSDGAGGTKALPLFVVGQRDAVLWGAEGSVEGLVRGRWVVGATGDVVRARDAVGSPLPFVPPARVGFSARYDDGVAQGGAGVRHAFAQGRVPAGEHRAGAYTLVDLHAGVRLQRGARVHSITLRADNVMNVLYRDATSRIKHVAPNPGRNVAVVYRVAQ
ncbi:MAG TPA: TonB-dependent receptor [Gemmatimonadaceae bacterium]|nr:TonB-dependent receptor [Gemmatimonadaceae bacterium]